MASEGATDDRVAEYIEAAIAHRSHYPMRAMHVAERGRKVDE